jgi:hypothetical protein
MCVITGHSPIVSNLKSFKVKAEDPIELSRGKKGFISLGTVQLLMLAASALLLNILVVILDVGGEAPVVQTLR